MKEEWLFSAALIPVDRETTHALVAEIKRLIDVVGGMALAQQEQEPVAWATREDFYRELDRRVERMRKEMEIKTVTMRCKDYDVALPIIDMHFGHVFVGQVSTTPKPPQSSMAWQEGCEAGRLAEREACAKICDHMASRCNDIRAAALESAAENIRARGNT